MERLCTEIRLHARLNAHPLQTVFFGGGTPSLIPPPLLARIISALEGNFGIAAGAEVSMEADPGTFDAPRLQAYMSEGVTRFSMGVQAFDEVRSSVLCVCLHRCIHVARHVGFLQCPSASKAFSKDTQRGACCAGVAAGVWACAHSGGRACGHRRDAHRGAALLVTGPHNGAARVDGGELAALCRVRHRSAAAARVCVRLAGVRCACECAFTNVLARVTTLQGPAWSVYEWWCDDVMPSCLR